MPRKDASRDALHALRAMAEAGRSDAGVARLEKLLGSRSNYVVGRAARLAADWGVEALAPALIESFVRFTEDPVKSDPGCVAKQASIYALITLGHNDPDIFLRGARYRQIEPSYLGERGEDPNKWKPKNTRREWEDPEPARDCDTAATLRGMCGDGLLRCGYADAHLVVTGLLMDPEIQTRRVAMEALGATASYPSELLIRMALLAGDPEIDIMVLGIQGLMAIAPARSLEFVIDFLYSPDPAIAESAALSIGEARLPESFPVLKDAWEGYGGPDKAALSLPIALTRDEAAIEFLLRAVETESVTCAAAAVEALAIFCGDAHWLARVTEVVGARAAPQVTEALARALAS